MSCLGIYIPMKRRKPKPPLQEISEDKPAEGMTAMIPIPPSVPRNIPSFSCGVIPVSKRRTISVSPDLVQTSDQEIDPTTPSKKQSLIEEGGQKATKRSLPLPRSGKRQVEGTDQEPAAKEPPHRAIHQDEASEDCDHNARHGSKEEETSGDPFDPKDKEEEEE
ncbi:hypothetical protein ADUPG1_008091, partial [Aduncisulcus paluster]